jgi:phage terminase Nu1 subunit (DNA packaging protein)
MGVTPGQVMRWKDDGCPVAVPGGPNRSALYDLKAVRAWRKTRPDPARPGGMSVAEESAKLKRAQRERTEQDNRRRAGELLERADVERVWTGHITDASRLLDSLPSAEAERCVHAAVTGGPAAVRRVLEEAVRSIKTALAGA